MSKASDTELAPFAKLLGMSLADVRELLKKGIVQVKDGKIDTAQSLLAVTRHLLATRDTAEAKARAAQADAALKEHRLKAASESRQKDAEKLGRGKWSKAAGERVCKLIETGKSLRQAAKAEGVTAAAVLKWAKRYPEFGKQYAQACELKYNLYADELDETLNEADRAALDPECGTQRIAALRLRIDTRKWQLGKMLPKIYGDRTQMVLETANPADILPKHTAEQDAAFMSKLAAIQAKTPPPEDITHTDDE
jgi:hypothetical protein